MEEINISGEPFRNHESEVFSAYNECIQSQAEFHKENLKLRRLLQMELDFVGNAGTSTKMNHLTSTNCQLDRWTYFAEHICK